MMLVLPSPLLLLQLLSWQDFEPYLPRLERRKLELELATSSLTAACTERLQSS